MSHSTEMPMRTLGRTGVQDDKDQSHGAGTIFVEDGMDWLVAPNITPDVTLGPATKRAHKAQE